jgi:hypothetical protein
MRKKVIQLPKNYISYSQIALWQNDRERYIALYMDDDQTKRLSNTGMDYGREVAEALEDERSTGDLLTDAAMLLVPKYDIRDKEIRVDMKTKDGAISLLGRPDVMDSITHSFAEYKTGKGSWTQGKAEKHLQLQLYAMMIYLAYGVIPPRVSLVWIETQDTEDGIKPTGKVKEFIVKIGLREILGCMAVTTRVAKEIEAVWLFHTPKELPEWDGPTEACGECGGWERHRQECAHCE